MYKYKRLFAISVKAPKQKTPSIHTYKQISYIDMCLATFSFSLELDSTNDLLESFELTAYFAGSFITFKPETFASF